MRNRLILLALMFVLVIGIAATCVFGIFRFFSSREDKVVQEQTQEQILTEKKETAEKKEKKESTPKETKKEEVKQPRKQISIAFTGDLLYEQGLYDWMDNYSFGGYLDAVKPLLSADFTIANQEVPIGGEELGVSGVAYTFNAPYEIAEQYPSLGIDYVTTATNHTVDMGVEGIRNTNAILDENSIGHTGSYTSEEDSEKISVVDVNGIKIAILAYTYGTNQLKTNTYDVNYFLGDGQFDDYHREKLESDVKKAQEQADVVFVAMHWGTEFTYNLTSTQTEVAKYLNELGVDLIIGNHPHTIQPAETLVNSEGKETVVFYSLGNFISSAAVVSRANTDFQNMYEIGAVGRLNVVKEDGKCSLQDVQVIPVVNHFEINYNNFQLIPFEDYTEELAAEHFQRYYNEYFTVEWLSQQIHEVFDDSGFLKVDF